MLPAAIEPPSVSAVLPTESNPTASEAVEERAYLRDAFRAMLKARLLEAKLSSLYKAGKIVGGVYLGKGQEAVSGCLGAALIPGKDVFAPLIRDQAGRTAFGEELLDFTRTYLGSALGPMRGRDGNIHRGRPSLGVPAMISHLGAAIPLVAGMLFAKRLKGELAGAVGATCIGDGGTSTGAFHEGLNMAAVERLPMIVIVADNQFAYSTPTNRQYACVDLVDRARGYGVHGSSVDGTDMLACAKVIRAAVQRARNGGGPELIVANLLRLSGHGEHDDASYVPAEVKRGRYSADCVEVAIRQMVAAGHVSVEEVSQWQESYAEEIQRAFAQAQQEPPPNPYQEDWRAFSTRFPESA